MDTPSPLKSVTGKLKPKTIAIIVVGGVAGGLILRKLRGNSGGGSTSVDIANVVPDGVDVSKLALAGSSAGNIGYASGGMFGANDVAPTSVDTGTRDTGTISLPVASWLIPDGAGGLYQTDGTTITPLSVPSVVQTVVAGAGAVREEIPTPVAAVSQPVVSQPVSYGVRVTGGAPSANAHPGDTFIGMVQTAYYNGATPQFIDYVAQANGVDKNAPLTPGQLVTFPKLFG